jgi:hypothetical protein
MAFVSGTMAGKRDHVAPLIFQRFCRILLAAPAAAGAGNHRFPATLPYGQGFTLDVLFNCGLFGVQLDCGISDSHEMALPGGFVGGWKQDSVIRDVKKPARSYLYRLAFAEV